MAERTLAAPAPTLDPDQLLAMFRQLGTVGTVELKMSVPSEQRMALRELGLDVLEGRIREVLYFDTADLRLFRNGVIVRARRTQGSDEDTAVKLRPALPAELPPAVRESPNLKIEMDITRDSYIVSASLRGKRRPGTLHEVTDGDRPVDRLLTKEQRPFLADHFPEGVGWKDLIPLGPIYVVVLKSRSSGFSQRLTIEQWHYPGQVPLVELSTKAAPLDTFRVLGEATEFLRGHGLRATGEQEPKTRRALEFFAPSAAADPPTDGAGSREPPSIEPGGADG
jgi:hypothetical protein